MKTVENPTSHTRTIEELLRLKRQEHPTAVYWERRFERSFARKMMGALARPRDTGRALRTVGWVGPAVFLACMAVAVGVAYVFSPTRAIARWEAAATERQYIVDSLSADASPRAYAIDSGLGGYSFASGGADGLGDYTPASTQPHF
jgi:hypothetical protein